MVKLYKFNGYYVDWNDDYSIDDVKSFMNYPGGSDLFPEFLKVEEAIIDENICSESEYEKYFIKE